MERQLWLIGGTAESAEIARGLAARSLPYWVTVTTAAGRGLYPASAQVQVGVLVPAEMATFIVQRRIGAVVDASHPFATAVSQGAIAAAAQTHCPYLRFERAVARPAIAEPSSPSDPTTAVNLSSTASKRPHLGWPAQGNPQPLSQQWARGETAGTLDLPFGSPSPNLGGKGLGDALSLPKGDGGQLLSDSGYVSLVPNLEALLTPERLAGQRVLLVLGYRMLHYFQPWQAHCQLFARILPSQTALAAAFEAGFTSDRLIALRPPIAAELECALWQQWGITRVIAKCSGPAGGEETKRAIAQELGIPLWLIERPPVRYPQQTDSIAKAIAFAQAALGQRSSSQ